MNYTTHYGLQKDLTIEKYDVNVVNMNSDIIDSALHRLDLKNQSQDNLLASKEDLNDEISRATITETEILRNLNNEISRANTAENGLQENIDIETSRAIDSESEINKLLVTHIADESNPHNVTKEQIGLGHVDNTSDTDKPVSIMQQDAINLAIADHNISSASHDDIRNIITELSVRLNTLIDSDDTTLDQLSEIVAYIKNNRSLIEGITANKVNVSDIIDDLTHDNPDKPLSAKQGKILKSLITDLTAIVNNITNNGFSSNEYTDEDKEIVQSFRNMTREEAMGILNQLENNAILDHLTITPPTKQSYTKGEYLDLSEMVVTAHYISGLQKNVTDFATCTPTNGSVLESEGEQTITISYTENGITKTTSISVIVNTDSQIVSWSDATEEELAVLLESHYNGEINLADYWHVGDERVVSLSDMKSDSRLDNESHEAQDVTLVIIDFNKDNLSSPINGLTKAALTVNLKNCLTKQGIIDTNYKTKEDNNQSFTASWSDCQRRAWCNTTFKNSLPAKLRNLIKVVKKSNFSVTYTYNNGYSSTGIYESPVNDSCFLMSPTEIYHAYATGSNKYEDDPNYEYFKVGNKNKGVSRWWLRKPMFGSNTTGWWDQPGAQFYRNTAGIAPAFCL